VLDARSRRIVEERWLKVNDDSSGGMTLHELAAEYGVSAERIRQIEVAAMKKMRKALAEQPEPSRRPRERPFVIQAPVRPAGAASGRRQRLGAAAVAREQAQPALGIEDVRAGGVVDGVAAFGLARHLGVEHLELLGRGRRLLGRAAQRDETRAEVAGM
jgi:hypothetical protein